MNKSGASTVLAFAAGYDKRTIGSADANAWALALPDVTIDDARGAVVQYYRDNTRPIMPGNITAILKAEAAKAPPLPLPPRSLPPDPGQALRGKALVAQAEAKSRAATAARRERVLGFPDLAARLTEKPLNYPQPGMWSGYVPPHEDAYAIPEPLHANGHPNARNKMTEPSGVNDTKRRAALVDICAEAMRRETAGEIPRGRTAEDDEW